ncbi:MAG: hypothetical protein ACW98U_02800 [Candidatus Thorarchaeota archaeon]
MKKFKTSEYTDYQINEFLESEIKTEGLLAKRNVELLERVSILYRPFRHIILRITGTVPGSEKTTSSLIDEDFAGFINDPDHKFLLWRPRLASIYEESIVEDEEPDEYPGNVKAVQEILDELVSLRWKAQEEDDELRPKLRSLQADPLSTIALIVPRSPGGLRREEEILEKRKGTHAYVLASSLVTNCSPRDIILSAEIGERAYVETIAAEYRDIESNTTRVLILETPGTKSFLDAKKAARASVRICQLYDSCYEKILESFP